MAFMTIKFQYSLILCSVTFLSNVNPGWSDSLGTVDDSILERYNITREEYDLWMNSTNFNGTFPPNLNGSVADKDDQYGYGYGYAGYGYPAYSGYAYPGYPGYPGYPSYAGYPGYPSYSTENAPPMQPPSPTFPRPAYPSINDADSSPANINDGIANKECYYLDTRGKDYRGFQHTTASGKQCQPWATTSKNPTTNPLDGLDENFCRNPSSEKKPWCYIDEFKYDWWGQKRSQKWAFCDIPSCDEILVSPKSQFTKRACVGLDVKGKIYTAYQDEPMRLPKTNCICKWGSWYCGSQQTEKPCTGIDNNKNLYVVYSQRGMKIGSTDCRCNNGIWFCDPVSAYNND